MTLLFFIIQSSFAIGGAIVVLFARKRKHAFWGWIAVLLTAVTLILPHHSETPWVVPLFLCSGGITGWLTLKEARRFDREPTQPRSLHLGISRIFLLLLTLYFSFLWVLCGRPLSLTSICQPMHRIRMWAGSGSWAQVRSSF